MELAIVLPVYNEENTLKDLLQDIHGVVSGLNIQYTIFAINNRSTDRSECIIKELSTTMPSLRLIQNNERGHGPSILKGYQLSKDYEWVFQFDSDYQYELAAFAMLWARRGLYDLLIAEREMRSASYTRDFITAVLRWLVQIFYARGIKDINSPFRLMRGCHLQDALQLIKAQSFAPNTLITAFFLQKKLRIYKTCCSLRQNMSVKKSRVSINIFIGCLHSVFDLLFFRFKL